MDLEEQDPLLRPVKPSTTRSQVRQFVATFAVNLLAYAFGMGMGWSSTALPILLSSDTPLTSGPITIDDASWLASILCIMAMVATPCYHYVCEHYGRKTCAYLTVIPGILSLLILIFGDTKVYLYVSRVLIGACFAGTFIYCPIYVTEIAENKIRGSLGVVIMLMRNAGILTAYVIGTYFSLQTVSWICLGPPLLFVVALRWLPESPMFLVRRGRYEEAAAALASFRGAGADVRGEVARMRAALAAMRSSAQAPATTRELLADATARRALLVTFVLFCNQQLCGFYGIVSYTVMIFQESGSSLSPNACSIIVGVMLLGGTVLSVALCDLTGRKTLLVLSDVLMAFVLVVFSAYFFCKSRQYDVSHFHWLPVTCLSVYVIVLNVGLASLPVLIATELFSPRFTSLGMTITAPSTWFLTFVVAKYFPIMSESMGIHGTCMIFALVCALGTIFVILFLPETKNKPIEDILCEMQSGWINTSCCKRRKPKYHVQNIPSHSKLLTSSNSFI